MDIKLTLTKDHAELLISVLENEMESLEQDHDIQEKLKRGLADDDIADYYTALNMIKEEVRVRLDQSE
tara:strand:- start:117 stop:320 length:204 start_codon:yes stop_codon:yes gene_type:complete